MKIVRFLYYLNQVTSDRQTVWPKGPNWRSRNVRTRPAGTSPAPHGYFPITVRKCIVTPRRYVVSPLPKCAKRPQFVVPAHAARQSKQRGSAAARLTAKLPNHYFPPNCHFYLLLSCFNWSLTALNTVSVTISISRKHFIIRTSITQRILIDKVC